MAGRGVRGLSCKWVFQLLILLACSALHAQSQGTVTYVYTDPQGTPLAEADAQGNITATYDYTPYGTTALGTPPNGPGYGGHVNDPETNLVYMQARYYDSATGHFISTDPIQPTAGDAFNFNRYVYVNNNPINHIDQNGKCIEDACIGEAIAVCAATPCGTAVAAAGASLIAILTVRAIQNTPAITQDSRSKPPPPLPEADGNPHPIPDGKGGYTTYPTGKATEGKQYRPTGKSHGNIPRPNC